MVVICKKRWLLIGACFCIFLCVFGLQRVINPKTKAVVAFPCSNKVIILDAGHRTGKTRVHQIHHGVTESEINLKIVLKVQSLLEQAGSTVILTRSDENAIYDLDKTTLREKKVSDIKNRVQIGNESQADIFVSIHLNQIPEGQYWGWQTFYRQKDEKSMYLAQGIQASLNQAIEKENKRESLVIHDKYIIDHVEIPITIIECGFLSNEEEANLLTQDSYQDRLAWGIYAGIMDYFSDSVF